MDYGHLLTKAWETIWNNKFLIGLGVLVGLSRGGGGGGGSGYRLPTSFQPGGVPSPGGGQVPPLSPDFGQALRQLGPELAAASAVVLLVICVVFLIGLALWVVGRIAEGGLINGVDEIESGRPSSFTLAWSAGWNRGWQLALIGLIAALPGLLLLIILGIMFYGYVVSANGRLLLDAFASQDSTQIFDALARSSAFWGLVLVVFCPFALVGWALAAIRAFADRACMIENKGVLDSYARGWEVLRNNLGQAILLLLIQIGLGFGVGVLLILPSLIVSVCCLLLPLLWLVSGTLQAYFSTLWTLAWREWVSAGRLPGEPMNPSTGAMG
jgi:hypothetical protein